MSRDPTSENYSGKYLDYLVLDSNAFIRGYGLTNLCKNAKCVVTIEEVIQEIRDSKAREALQNLPFELVIRAPSSTDCADVATFAKSSGDFHSLSKTDLKLIALTKMLEKEISCTASPSMEVSHPEVTANDQNANSVVAQSEIKLEEKQVGLNGHPDVDIKESANQGIVDTISQSSDRPVAGDLQGHHFQVQSAILSSSSNQYSYANESKKLEEDDDGVGWIDSDNFHERLDDVGFSTVKSKKRSARKTQPTLSQDNIKVACFTSDFTMQNVLLQLGLHVLSAEGMLVKTVRKFVLRCNACFTVHTKDLSRLFCSRCGSNLLSRISASIEEGGKLRLHLKKNYKLDTTGMKYSLPAPGKQDRFQGELLFREDQLLTGIWRQKVVKINKDVKSAFGEDVTSDVGLHLNKQDKIVIGLGKGNPNARKGRERRGKKAR